MRGGEFEVSRAKRDSAWPRSWTDGYSCLDAAALHSSRIQIFIRRRGIFGKFCDRDTMRTRGTRIIMMGCLRYEG